jgi:hypothetical protein
MLRENVIRHRGKLCVALGALVAAGLLAGGCGGEDEAEETGAEATTLTVPGADQAASLQEEIANLSDEAQVARVGEAWAESFAAGREEMCGFLHPDLGGASSCSEYVGATGSPQKLEESFTGTSVEEVEVTGDTAEAEFSNGERVGFGRDPDGAWKVTEWPDS